jgi:16S rRNA (guanine1516-N2)-methyltransferase
VRLTISGKAEKIKKVNELALRLDLSLSSDQRSGLVLYLGERLELLEAGSKTGPVYVDFETLAKRSKQKKDLIAKAVGIKSSYRPTIIDATAGLGQDAFILASYGCQVTMIERSKVIAALLQDGLERARHLETVSGLTLLQGDAKDLLPTVPTPDVIYLDPMYPESGKTALKRKEMRLFRELLGDDLDVDEVLELALQTAQKRVVLKRPLKAKKLGKPSSIFEGSTIRFDVYLTPCETKKSRA